MPVPVVPLRRHHRDRPTVEAIVRARSGLAGRQRFLAALVERREVDRVAPRDEVRFLVLAPARLRDPPADRVRGGGGISAPFARASFRPIAMACVRLRTRAPDPLRRVPRLRRRIADSTVFGDVAFRFAMPGPPRLRRRE
jgi:hypothetical protein